VQAPHEGVAFFGFGRERAEIAFAHQVLGRLSHGLDVERILEVPTPVRLEGARRRTIEDPIEVPLAPS
jgi:hypothetical protein